MTGTPTQEQLDGVNSNTTQWGADAKRVYDVGESGETTSENDGITSQKFVTDRELKDLMADILIEIKKLNLHLQSITDEEIQSEDINDNEY